MNREDEFAKRRLDRFLKDQLKTYFGKFRKAIEMTQSLSERLGGYENFLLTIRPVLRKNKRLGSLPQLYIRKRICEEYGLDEKTFMTSGKRGMISVARQLYVVLVAEFELATDTELSKPFGRKRDFARRYRAEFKDIYETPIERLGGINKRMVHVYSKIRFEMLERIRGNDS